jgi:hypothetical protein
MPGGEFDSSKTRVTPFFDHLLERDPKGSDWLGPLLSLPEQGSDRAAVPASLGGLHDHAWGEDERALDPPTSLLRWLVSNLKCPSSMKQEKIRSERRELIDGDPERIAGGLQLLDDGPGGRRGRYAPWCPKAPVTDESARGLPDAQQVVDRGAIVSNHRGARRSGTLQCADRV